MRSLTFIAIAFLMVIGLTACVPPAGIDYGVNVNYHDHCRHHCRYYPRHRCHHCHHCHHCYY